METRRGGAFPFIPAVPYDRWLKFILPFMLKIWLAGSIALAVAVVIGYA